MMNTDFTVKTYPKSELALLYFPGSEAWFYLFYCINAYGNVSLRMIGTSRISYLCDTFEMYRE